MSQEEFLKKQAVQLCKGHPLINTLNALYKLKAEDSNDITTLVHTIEVQNKIITDVSYQLAHMYNLGGSNGKDSLTYIRELTNNIFSGKARQPVANVNKSMVPVKAAEKQIESLKELYNLQRFSFEEHIVSIKFALVVLFHPLIKYKFKVAENLLQPNFLKLL